MLSERSSMQFFLNSPQKRRHFLNVAALGGTAYPLTLCGEEPRKTGSEKSSFILWQLPPQTTTQMNSYVLKTQNDMIIVIDGGTTGDAPYLKGFLAALGNNVSHWFISHPHSDHLDAVTAILNDPGNLNIGAFHGSLPSGDWIARYEPGAEQTIVAFLEALEIYGIGINEHSLGQNGVNEEFYRTVHPSYCLWPTPDWLWDNDNGGGVNSGPWATLTVRKWMEKLPVIDHYISKDGLCCVY